MILQAHPISNMFVKQLARGFARAGVLREFWTGVRWPSDDGLLRWLPDGARRTLRRRGLPPEVEPHVHTVPWMEAARLLAHRLRLRKLVAHEHGRLSVDAVFHHFDRRVAARLRGTGEGQFRAVYGYEDGAQLMFDAARERGLLRCYDLPIGYWRAARRLLTEEAALSPEWAGTLHGNRDSERKVARKDAELALADLVVVASSFTRRTLEEDAGYRGRIVVVPYGAPATPQGFRPAERQPGEPLRVMFVGSLGQRKGLRYLLEAVDLAGRDVQLTLIGAPAPGECAPLARALAQHRHLASLPHSEVLAEMGRHHVFVFPSLFEGFGLVVLEAMARGLPVIATPHTCGPDVIRDGEDGFVVPIRSAGAIAERLNQLAADEPRRRMLAHAAMARAAQFTWDDYGRRITDAVIAALEERKP